MFPDPKIYAEVLDQEFEENTSRVFWMPDNVEYGETGKWTSRAIIDGQPTEIVMQMDPDQDLAEGAEVTLSTGGIINRVEPIEDALERISRLYPERTTE